MEVTSFGKMEHILTYGCYHVGSTSGQAVHSIHDVIDLHLVGIERQLPKMNYSLDDLRDLESKLVLITGRKAENRKDVDKFLNVNIVHNVYSLIPSLHSIHIFPYAVRKCCFVTKKGT